MFQHAAGSAGFRRKQTDQPFESEDSNKEH